MLLVGQAEGQHAEPAGQLVAERRVALVVRRDGAGHVAQQLGSRLAREGLQRVQAERPRAGLREGLEQVDGAEPARVDGERRDARARPAGRAAASLPATAKISSSGTASHQASASRAASVTRT